MNRSGMLICLIGPSGSGKSTIAQRLLQNDTNISFSVSLTTRSPRIGEQNGVNYEFVSREEFTTAINNQELFEWEEVHGNYYGTKKSTLDDAVQNGKDLLLDIDIKGAITFSKKYPKDAVVIFITPPSIDVLKQRLRNRGNMSDEEFSRRLQTAEKEFSTLLASYQDEQSFVDYFVVNDDLNTAYNNVSAILSAERVRLSRLNKDDVSQMCHL